MNYLLILLTCFLAAGSLRGRQEIVGAVTPEELLRELPEWQAVAASYSPAPEAVERLRAVSREVLVEVVLGTWCDDSKSHVSELMKVLEAVDNPLIRATYAGVPEDKAKRAVFLQGRDIVKIPTFIVSVEGVEKGRIVEAPVKSVEADLADILSR